jgi:hypothetical protein
MKERKEWRNDRKQSILTAKGSENEKTRQKEKTRLRPTRKLAIREVEGKLAKTSRIRQQGAAEDQGVAARGQRGLQGTKGC